MRLALACSLLLTGCHWLYGHQPGAEPEARVPDGPRQEQLATLDVAGEVRAGDHAAPGPDLPRLDSSRHDTSKADTAKPDTAKPDTAKPDTSSSPDLLNPAKLVKLGAGAPAQTVTGTAYWSQAVQCGAASAVLVVGIALVDGTATAISSVKANGSTLSLGKASAKTALYYLASPPSSVTITVSLQAGATAVAGSASFCNLHLAKLGTWGAGEAPSSNNVGVTPVYTPGSAIVDLVITSGPSLSFSSNHTKLWDKSEGGYQIGMGWKSALSSSTFSWTSTSSASWSYSYGTLWSPP